MFEFYLVRDRRPEAVVRISVIAGIENHIQKPVELHL